MLNYYISQIIFIRSLCQKYNTNIKKRPILRFSNANTYCYYEDNYDKYDPNRMKNININRYLIKLEYLLLKENLIDSNNYLEFTETKPTYDQYYAAPQFHNCSYNQNGWIIIRYV